MKFKIIFVQSYNNNLFLNDVQRRNELISQLKLLGIMRDLKQILLLIQPIQ